LTPAEQREREQILGRVREAAALLKSRFGARRVVLFGSLAHAAWFASDSDVDLAVEGLVGEDYWQAWREIEAIVEDRPVDLIEVEMAGESLRRAIERYGVEL
jgi:predicted nucleotidyltransferase